MLLASYFPGSANAWSINHTDSALLNEVVVTPWEPRVVRTRDWFRAEDNRVPVGVSLTVEGHHVAPWGEGEDSADTVPFVRIVRYTPGYAAASSDMHWEPSKAGTTLNEPSSRSLNFEFLSSVDSSTPDQERRRILPAALRPAERKLTTFGDSASISRFPVAAPVEVATGVT